MQQDEGVCRPSDNEYLTKIVAGCWTHVTVTQPSSQAQQLCYLGSLEVKLRALQPFYFFRACKHRWCAPQDKAVLFSYHCFVLLFIAELLCPN